MEEKRIHADEVNPYGLLLHLLKNAWVVVLLCISTLLCYTSVCRLTYRPMYTSTATFMVSAKDGTSAYNSLTTTQSMASVFVEVFRSNVLRDKINEQMPDGKFDGTFNTATIPETNILIVTATSSEPDRSFRALQLLVENYSSVSDYLFSNAQLEVIKDPVVPVAPSNVQNLKEQYPVILTIAACLSIGLVALLYLLRKTVKTPAAARKKVDARLLRIIDHEVKNKTLQAKLRRVNSAPLITNTLISKRFIENNLGLCSVLDYHARKRGQKVIMITSLGENEGKSTVAANLALSMAEKGKKVVLLDCDFRKPSLHKIFETPVQKDKSLTSFLLQESTDFAPYLTESKKHGIRLGLSHSSGKSITKLLSSGQLPQLLQALRKDADYVLLDTPPMLAVADAEVIAAMVDAAVLVVREDYMPTASINEGLDRLRKITPEVCGIVLNNHRSSIW